MNTAQEVLKQAVDNSVKCAKEWTPLYDALSKPEKVKAEKDYLIGSLRSKIRTLCNELDQFKAIEIRLGWVCLEKLVNDHADEINEPEHEVISDLLELVKRHAGGPGAIQSALREYESDPEILNK